MQRLTPKVSRVTLLLTICLLSFTLSSCQKASKGIAEELGREFGKGAADRAGNEAMRGLSSSYGDKQDLLKGGKGKG